MNRTRLKGWDYTSNGYYFITICTHQRICYFGQVARGQIILSTVGRLAYQFWAEIPAHFPFVSLDEFVIMPNHIHGILVLSGSRDVAMPRRDVALQRLYPNNIGNDGKNEYMSHISPKPGSVSTIVRSYKSIVSRTANREYPTIGFGWQARFYDHILRSEAELQRIQTYIKNNPRRWVEDSLYISDNTCDNVVET